METSERKCQISVYGKRHENLVQFFKMERELVVCTDIDGLKQTLNINHNPLDWRLFIDSSKLSLKNSSPSQWQHPTFYSCWSFSA